MHSCAYNAPTRRQVALHYRAALEIFPTYGLAAYNLATYLHTRGPERHVRSPTPAGGPVSAARRSQTRTLNVGTRREPRSGAGSGPRSG